MSSEGAHQIIRIHVAVHPDVGATRCQIANDPTRAWPEVLEGVLSVDAAFNRVSLPHQG
jgi:hypothetical protein